MSTPLLLIAFNRPEHIKRAIEALRVQHPPLVYVFQDGPRRGNTSDKEYCALVRSVIIKEINWPCELHTYYSETNHGCRDTIINAITTVLNQHDSVIVVEDDIITSPAFYSFMCKALEYYKNRKTVFSISGHSHSPSKFEVPADYDYDVFASPRLFNWGWGTWRDRWSQIDWSFGYYDDFIRHPYEKKAFCRGGDDLFPLLVDERTGKSSAWDIQFAFSHFANHAVSIVPCVSYTYNIGMDGSGTHCHATSSEDQEYVLNQKTDPRFLGNLYYDSRIINSLNSIFVRKKRPAWKKAVNFIARKIRMKPPFIIKTRVYAED